MSDRGEDGLRELARLHGVQVEYVDAAGKAVWVSDEALIGVLGALGVPVSGPGDVPDALRAGRLGRRGRRLEPVALAWDGDASGIAVRPGGNGPAPALPCRLDLESGERREWTARPGPPGPDGSRQLELPGGLPLGYHRLTVEFSDGEARALIIAAPTRAEAGPDGREWGLFCPLYGLHRPSSWGAGDFADLEALMDWTADVGGHLVATLPMLATAIGDAPGVSPYSPTSRLFWNEFYLDLGRIPELAGDAEARAMMDEPAFRAEVEALRGEPLVHYGRQMRLKRRVLERLADRFFAGESARSAEYRRFVADHPEVEDYATFRAAAERHGHGWAGWPAALRGPEAAGKVDPRARRYHLYAQWQADEQLRGLSDRARARGLTWYVDFPVGVDAGSFDVWRQPELFALGASVGSPPDPVFTKGQGWGFPPLHPDRLRDDGYAYLVACVRHHLRYAGALRLDHVMGLHRLYWIPRELDASRGAYVSYPAEEIYAILALESHRERAWLVGENLGTVPPEVDDALGRHGVRGMYVVQYELRPDEEEPLRPVPREAVASVNTHDMPPFAAHWAGHDVRDRADLGLIADDDLDDHLDGRDAMCRALSGWLVRSGLIAEGEDDPGAVLRACHDVLAGSPARVVLLNLEDLWLETEPQNTPNTVEERANWRRKLRHGLDEFARDPAVLEALARVAGRRRETAAAPGPEPAAAT